MLRRQIGASALAVTALLTVGFGATGVAHAASPASVAADDIFYPNDQKPADAATPAPADAAPATDAADREASLMRGSRQAADMIGYLPSLYQGKWYVAKDEDVRRCIMDRESNFNYRAVGAGRYFGAYQMNRDLAIGATYVIQKEIVKEMGEEGVALVKALRQIAPNSWNRYWQDRAFWTIWRNGAGAGHWRGGGLNCF